MRTDPPVRPPRRISARLRLTLSYAGFLVAAGAIVLAAVYVVLRYVPDYPLAPLNPGDVDLRRTDAVPASREHILSRLLLLSGVALVGLAAIGMAGGWLLAGWILRPLHEINAAARIAADGRLDHRIRLAGRSDEFAELADTFDHMLDRLHDAFLTQERFAANASHELRTPLAVTATILEVAQSDPAGRNDPVLLERLRVTNARAIELTEAVLRLADVDAVTAVAAPLDLADVARAARDEQADEARRRPVVVHDQLAAAPTVGDAALLRRLAANLVQNAVRHNVPGGAAWISTHADPEASCVVLQVRNTGAVYREAEAARLVEPFLRGAGRIDGGDPDRGSGLGLTLVARITAVHGGTLTVLPRDGGGLVVTVTLPDRRRGPVAPRGRPVESSLAAPVPLSASAAS